MLKRILLSLALLAGMAAPAAAAAMSSGSTGEIKDASRVIPFAKKVERLLAERGVAVAIVSRVGRDPEDLPDGIAYTHVGLWVYSEITTADGRKVRGYVSHNLYQLDENLDRSALAEDFPAEFFGDVHELKAGVIVPKPELQARLLKVIDSPTYARLHVPDYSLVANPYDWRYQNCTNFIMANLAVAIYGTEDRDRISADLKAHYAPQPVGLNGLERTFGPLFVGGFHTADHDGPLKTSTFGSVARFLQSNDLAEAVFEVTEESPSTN